jgi:hypothetical protein
VDAAWDTATAYPEALRQCSRKPGESARVRSGQMNRLRAVVENFFTRPNHRTAVKRASGMPTVTRTTCRSRNWALSG